MGLPGSGKTTFAAALGAELFFNKKFTWFNADAIRERYNDWDFSAEGRLRQARRMRYLADGVELAGKIAVADFVCPTELARLEFAPDYTVWMDTIKECKYEDTNQMFEPPQKYNLRIESFNYNMENIIHDISLLSS